MKNVLVAAVITVGLSGALIAQTPELALLNQNGWQSVADATAQLAKDPKTQNEATKSIKKIVEAVQEFIEFGVKEIYINSDAQGKENIKELLNQLDMVLEKYMPAIKAGDFDTLDAKAQEECNQAVQELVMFAMPLIAMLDQSEVSLSMDDAFAKNVWIELVSGVQKALSHVKKEIK